MDGGSKEQNGSNSAKSQNRDSKPKSQMQVHAWEKFAGFDLTVPQKWADPAGDPGAGQYYNAFTPQQWGVTPDANCVPPLSVPQSGNWYWVDVQMMHNARMGNYLNGICSSITSAWSQWQSSATMSGVVVNGPTATGGTLVGPPLAPLIIASGPQRTPMERKYTRVIANVIGEAWLEFTQTVKVPGLPFYPAFAAFPGPVGAPMPNVPVPFAALVQVPFPISSFVTKQAMIGQLADPRAPLHKELFDAVAYAFEMTYETWKVATMVTNVIGTGPVPSFAPPFVPVGPVVGGVATMIAGGLVGGLLSSAPSAPSADLSPPNAPDMDNIASQPAVAIL
jgi:hypothetical protein